MKFHPNKITTIKEKDMTELRFICVIRKLENERSYADRRKKVDKYICEYRDKNNVEYRKSFEFKVGEKPNIPEKLYTHVA